MKKKIIGLVIALSLIGLGGCAKKAFFIIKTIQFEAGSEITLDDLVTIDPSGKNIEVKGEIENKIPGMHEIRVSADFKEEYVEVLIEYQILDTTAPVLTQNSIPTVAKDDPLKLSDYVTVTDNSGEDLTAKLDETIPDTSVSGDFEIEVTLTDASGNPSTLAIKYTVMNDAPPVIKQTFVPTLPQGYVMKLSEILSVTDDSGEDFKSKLAAVKIDSSVLGDHEVTFKIKDSAGNESSINYTYTVVASNVLAPRITVKTSHLNENGKTSVAQITFNGLTIVDKLNGIPDVTGKKYIVMDLTIKNVGTDAFSDLIFQMPEIMHPEVVAREIVFSSGEAFPLSYQDIISADSSKTYDSVWDVGQTWRLYWYCAVPDDFAKKDFVIDLPINFSKYKIYN